MGAAIELCKRLAFRKVSELKTEEKYKITFHIMEDDIDSLGLPPMQLRKVREYREQSWAAYEMQQLIVAIYELHQYREEEDKLVQ